MTVNVKLYANRGYVILQEDRSRMHKLNTFLSREKNRKSQLLRKTETKADTYNREEKERGGERDLLVKFL